MSVHKGIRPNLPKVRHDDGKNKTLYTVNHTHANSVPYTVLTSAKDVDSVNMRSSVVSFRELDHAIMFAGALEEYKQRVHHWPTINLEELNYLFFRELIVENSYSELDIVSWESQVIGSYCKHNALNLMILSSYICEPTMMKLQGTLVRFPFEHDSAVERLNSIYEGNSSFEP